MELRRLTLRDYRNFEHAELALGPRFTVLFGHNGAGKTNVLEAIYLVATLRSFRTSDQSTLVRHGATQAAAELRAYDTAVDLESTLAVRLERGTRSTRRTAVADGKTVRAAADFYGRIRAVLFTPEDLAVLRGPPAGRRQFLDRVVFARERAHIGDVQRYEKLVRSRNLVLRRDDVPASERADLLATYEEGLAQVGARIWTRRTLLLERLADAFVDAFARIHGTRGPSPQVVVSAPRAELHYDARFPEPDTGAREALLAATLRQRRDDDRRRGSTSVGPHRDDLRVLLDGRAAGSYASQGQARALVLAFKLAELRQGRELRGTPPVLLLDDVSSELDPRRLALLFETLDRDAGQCVLTTTAAQFVDLPAGAEVTRYGVREGVLEAQP